MVKAVKKLQKRRIRRAFHRGLPLLALLLFFTSCSEFKLWRKRDKDRDGVVDKQDKCPGTPPGAAVDPNGYPFDRDGDGVADTQDKCPDAPAGVQVDANGCPLDGDGDGVPDYQDKCPDRAGPASNRGCPETRAEDEKTLREATKYINFDSNKAVLLPSSYPTLQGLATSMAEHPAYKLSIAGHTDNQESNSDGGLLLSGDRVAAARAYLLSQAIPADRIVSRSFGDTRPLADSATAAGRAANRRVEFSLSLADEPNSAEVEAGSAPASQPQPVKATASVGSSGQSECFEEGSAVYNTPRKMVKGRVYNVVFSLVAGVVDSLQPRPKGTAPRHLLPRTKITAHHLIIDSYLGVPVVPNERNISLERIKITRFMSIDLKSDTSYFRVNPEKPQIFVDVKSDTIQQRRWSVEPKKAGERLPLNFIIEGSCDDINLKNSKPFHQTIEVSVTEPPLSMPDQITKYIN